MKQDSYSRFLKSDLYKQCVMSEMEGKPLPFLGDDSLLPFFEKPKEEKKVSMYTIDFEVPFFLPP